MPDDEMLAQMYGIDYVTSDTPDPSAADPKEPLRVIEWLKKEQAGTFIDYGCGAGALLKEAIKLNWRAVGVELNEDVAREVERRTGAKVLSRPDELYGEADILHLGDVVEHLTLMNSQMPEILKLIKPGGLLVAQGPLENNASLFTSMIRLSKSLRRSRPVEIAPYHVMLATTEGQKRLFQRFGLEEVEYSLSEVAWPAPARLSFSDMKRPRPAGLFFLRRVSQAASAMRPSLWGNRYFYVGRVAK
jgi:SAM-dependent methyltransferase